MAKNEVSIIIRARDAAASAFRKVTRNLRAVGRTAANVAKAVSGAALSVGGALFAFTRLSERGDKVINVQKAFARVVGDDVVGALDKLRRASANTISDFDLMVGLNRAVTLGSAENVDQFAELVKISRALAKTQGIDQAFALESLNTGIARQSRLFLDNLGIIVSVEKANQDYADALGITVDELTDAQKREAFRTAAIKAAREATQQLGTGTATAGEAASRFVKRFKDVRDELAEFVARSPEVRQFFETLIQGLNTVAEKAPGIIEKLARVARFAVGALDPVAERTAKMLDELRQAPGFGTAEFFEAERRTLTETLRAIATDRNILAERINRRAGRVVATPGIEQNELERLLSHSALSDLSRDRTIQRFVDLDQRLQAQRRVLDFVEAQLRALRESRAGEQGPQQQAATAAGGGVTFAIPLSRVLGPHRGIGFAPDLIAPRFTGEGFTPGDIAPGGLQLSDRLRQSLLAGSFAPGTFDVRSRLFGLDVEKFLRENLKDAEDEFSNAGEVVASNMLRMAEAATQGSAQMEQVVLQSSANIIQSIPKIGFAGTLIGGALGLIGSLFGRDRREPVRVNIADVEPQAESKLKDERTGPGVIHISITDPLTGRTIEDIEYALRRRTRTDAIERLPSRRL